MWHWEPILCTGTVPVPAGNLQSTAPEHGGRVFGACTAGTCLCRSHRTPGRALSLTPNRKTVWKEQEIFISGFWTYLLLPLHSSSTVFSFLHARMGRVQCAEVASGFPMCPHCESWEKSKRRYSKIPGRNVGPELPGDQEQSNKPR